MKPLTLLSLGLGRDSMTILALLMEGKCLVNGKRTRLDQIDGVVFSDTGAEWEFTMALIPKVTRVCVRAGVPFYWLKKPPMKEVLKFEAVFERQRRKVIKRAGDPYKGHSPYKGAPELRRGEGTKLRAAAPWRRRRYRSIDQKAELGGYHELIPIEQELQLLARIATKARKDCTVRHKIEPIRELLNDLLEVKYDTTLVQWGLGVKAGLLKPNNMLLGLAADEAGRMQEWKPDPRIKPTKAGKWPKKAVRWGVRDVYPLDEGKITKAKEGAILRRHGWGDVKKSGCSSCPHQSWHWYWVLSRRHPKRFADVVFLEKHSLETRKRYGKARRKKSEKLGLMYVRGERPIADEVYNKARSRLAFWDMHRKGKLPTAFIRKIQETIDPNWPGPASDLALAHLPEPMKVQMEEIILAKGYDRACGFGDD